MSFVKKRDVILLCIWSLICMTRARQTTAQSSLFCRDVTEATAFSIVYGFPVMKWKSTVIALLRLYGTNNLYFQRNFATPALYLVPSPNVDTLYGAAALDLSTQDLVIDVPAVDAGRYWSLAFTDPYGNNFHNIGSVTASRPGQYLVRRATDLQHGRSDRYLHDSTEYEGIITCPTTYAILNTRYYIVVNTSHDLGIVHSLQNATKIHTRNRTSSTSLTVKAPSLSVDLLTTTASFAASIAQDLELLARVAPHNPPLVPQEASRMASILASAGLYDQHYHRPACVNLTAASSLAATKIKDAASNRQNLLQLGNGWYTDALSLAGNFGPNYAYRAYIAVALLFQLVPSQALYPRHSKYHGRNYTLAANRSLLFTFSDMPPVRDGGFWSLTVYNDRYGLIDNPVGRYSIGSRDVLGFLDGTSGRAVPGTRASKGTHPFQILMQDVDVVPPANWTSNWLPSTAGGGVINFGLRWYAPSTSFTNGSYVYPVIEEIAARGE